MHTLTLFLAAASSPLGPPAAPIAIPGTNLLRGLLAGFATVVVILAVIGLLASAAAMAIGSHSSNGRLADAGRRGLVTCLVAGAVAGGADALIVFVWTLGGKIH